MQVRVEKKKVTPVVIMISLSLQMFRMLVSNNLQGVFLNVFICLRIYFSLLVTNCSGERSFSALKRVKNYLRSTLGDDKWNSLTLMHAEASVLRKTDFSFVLDEFVDQITRKVFN